MNATVSTMTPEQTIAAGMFRLASKRLNEGDVVRVGAALDRIARRWYASEEPQMGGTLLDGFRRWAEHARLATSKDSGVVWFLMVGAKDPEMEIVTGYTRRHWLDRLSKLSEERAVSVVA